MNWQTTTFLEEKLKEYYIEKAKPRVRDKLSVSDTGCVLHRELKMWGIKPDRAQSLQESMTFDFGNMIHSFLQERLSDMELLEIKEMELEDDFTIGHADALVREGDLLVPYEFKSIKDYGLDRIVAEGKPQDNHVKQLMGYFRLMKKLDTKNLADYGRIIYIAKCFDDSHRKFIYKNNPMAADKTILRLVEFKGDYNSELAAAIEVENELVANAVATHEILPCSEWDKGYHQQPAYNQYLSWCEASLGQPELLIERLAQETK